MRVIYLLIMKITLKKYNDKKEKPRNTLVNAKRPLHWARWKVTDVW